MRVLLLVTLFTILSLASSEIQYDSHGLCGWIINPWSSCSLTCGGGLMYRAITCVYADNSPAPDSVCIDAIGFKPDTQQSCNTNPCTPVQPVVTYNWVITGFSACSVQCGGGIAQPIVVCQSTYGTYVDQSLCDSTTKPTATQACNQQACVVTPPPVTYTWAIGSWTTQCIEGYYSRQILCLDSTGLPVSTSLCVQYTGQALPNSKMICQPPVQVIGDPQFTGFMSQSFQIHGIPNSIYNIISDNDIQMNARFVFLTNGKCPIVNGIRQQNCWSHKGTYLGEIGIKTLNERLYILSGNAEHGFERITLNDRILNIGDEITFGNGYISYNNTHTLNVQVSRFSFVFENSDHFINQQINLLNWNNITSHGLLGQTHTRYENKNKLPIIGTIDDYLIESGNLFGDDFMYNQFRQY